MRDARRVGRVTGTVTHTFLYMYQDSINDTICLWVAGSIEIMSQKKQVDQQSMLPIGTTLQNGKYKVVEYLSSGGFGNTYIVVNTKFDEKYAMKEFFMKDVCERKGHNTVSVSNSGNRESFAQQKEKFNKEAQRIRKFNNKHIVKVHDLFDENDTSYYIMDFISGGSLADRMELSGKPFNEHEVMRFLPQILDGLEEVHRHSIWHLDLHPKNIMLDNEGNIVLIDFGASKQLNPDNRFSTSSAFCYHQGYAPTEQIDQNITRIGAWTDLYALGATLYNLLTKLPPLSTSDIQDGEEFSYPYPVSKIMQEMIAWMMQPNRKKRPKSVEDVKDYLRRETEKSINDNTSKDEDNTFYKFAEQARSNENIKEQQTIKTLKSLISKYDFSSLCIWILWIVYELLSFLGVYLINLNYLHESLGIVVLIFAICLLKYLPNIISHITYKENRLITDIKKAADYIFYIQGAICAMTVLCLVLSFIIWLIELTENDSRSLWEIISNWA